MSGVFGTVVTPNQTTLSCVHEGTSLSAWLPPWSPQRSLRWLLPRVRDFFILQPESWHNLS